MGFKKYVAIAPASDVKALIREGAELYGSTRKLADQLVFSYSQVYRWSNSENAMSLKDYLDIKKMIVRKKGKIHV